MNDEEGAEVNAGGGAYPSEGGGAGGANEGGGAGTDEGAGGGAACPCDKASRRAYASSPVAA